jgi:hypothetical protein
MIKTDKLSENKKDAMKDFLTLKELVDSDEFYSEIASDTPICWSNFLFLDTFKNKIVFIKTQPSYDLLFMSRFISLNFFNLKQYRHKFAGTIKELAQTRMDGILNYYFSSNKKEKFGSYSFAIFMSDNETRNRFILERANEIKDFCGGNSQKLNQIIKSFEDNAGNWLFQKKLIEYLKK